MADGWHFWLNMMALKAESTFIGLIRHTALENVPLPEQVVAQEEKNT